MYFLKTGPPAQLQWLRVFEPLMVITGIVQPLATIPSISSCASQGRANMRRPQIKEYKSYSRLPRTPLPSVDPSILPSDARDSEMQHSSASMFHHQEHEQHP
jgi:hypothetical protein